MITHYQSIAVNDPGQLAGKLNEWKFKEVKVLSGVPAMGQLNTLTFIYLVKFTFNTIEEKKSLLKELGVKEGNIAPQLIK